MLTKTNNILGQTFHYLTVTSKSLSRGKENRLLWDCQCKCGQKKVGVKSSDLKRGFVRSCGCILRGKHHYDWRGHEEISGRYWNSLKRAAEMRNIPFKISLEQAWKCFLKQNKKCVLTGVDLKFSSTTRATDGNASLDRINSKEGYTPANIQWLHKWVNIMKWDLTTEEFIDMCRKVVDNSSQKTHKASKQL